MEEEVKISSLIFLAFQGLNTCNQNSCGFETGRQTWRLTFPLFLRVNDEVTLSWLVTFRKESIVKTEVKQALPKDVVQIAGWARFVWMTTSEGKGLNVPSVNSCAQF